MVMLSQALRFIAKVAFAIIVFALVVIVVRTNPEPYRKEQISTLTAALNEAAAIGVPHGFLMGDDVRVLHAALINKVEAGDTLSIGESAEYRRIFQNVLHDSQAFLGRFDAQLTIINDHAMQDANNTQEQGIAGHHDHHDVSARLNFAGVLESLENLSLSKTPFGRIFYANRAQKDLVDLISHIGVAPHTVSVTYSVNAIAWSDERLGSHFENMLLAFKAAQFEPIHSPQYWAGIDQGLSEYDALILLVQDRVMQHTSAWERRISGRFLSAQTLAPPVELTKSLRRK
jgi:hypothetical protein